MAVQQAALGSDPVADGCPLQLSRPNRFSRRSAGGGQGPRTGDPVPAVAATDDAATVAAAQELSAAVAEEEEKQRRRDGAVVAIRVLVPDTPEHVIRWMLEEHGDDPDAAMEALLGGAGVAPDDVGSGLGNGSIAADAVAAAAVADLAPSRGADAQASMPELYAPPTSPTPPAQSQPQPQQPRQAQPQPQKQPAPPQDSGPPPWLPMLRPGSAAAVGSGGTTAARRNHFDKRTDLLKAALGPAPSSSSFSGPSMSDLGRRAPARAGGG